MTRYSAATAPVPAAARPGPSPPIHELTITAATSSGRDGNLSNVRCNGRGAITATAVTAKAITYARARPVAGTSRVPEPVFILRLLWDPSVRTSTRLLECLDAPESRRRS